MQIICTNENLFIVLLDPDTVFRHANRLQENTVKATFLPHITVVFELYMKIMGIYIV